MSPTSRYSPRRRLLILRGSSQPLIVRARPSSSEGAPLLTPLIYRPSSPSASNMGEGVQIPISVGCRPHPHFVPPGVQTSLLHLSPGAKVAPELVSSVRKKKSGFSKQAGMGRSKNQRPSLAASSTHGAAFLPSLQFFPSPKLTLGLPPEDSRTLCGPVGVQSSPAAGLF